MDLSQSTSLHFSLDSCEGLSVLYIYYPFYTWSVVALRIIQLAVALHWSHTVDAKASQGMFLTSQNAFSFEYFCITVKIL